MRKLILIIALTMVPLGIWTAGCRNENRQAAAFPDTPEMKALARTAGKDGPAAAPVIPPAPIDRDILRLPENDTLARVRAVSDKASLYASERAGHGLFDLPEEKNYVASAGAGSAPGRGGARNAPEGMTPPPPSAREFWSRPPARFGGGTGEVPPGVSAMAGPSGRSGTVPPAPAPEKAAGAGGGSNRILPPDDMPGLFMVDGIEEPEEAPPPARGWFGMLRRNKGDALGAPPLSSSASVASHAPRGRRMAEITEARPLRLDIEKLMAADAAPKRRLSEQRFAAAAPEAFPPIPRGARIVSSAGMNFEPLPEPMPISQYNTMVMKELAETAPGGGTAARMNMASAAKAPPAPARSAGSAKAFALPLPAELISSTGESPSSIAAPAIPELTEAKMAVEKTAKAESASFPGAAGFANAEKALEPLPDLASLGPTPGKPRMTGKVVAMPEPMPEALPPPETAKAALMEFSPEAMDEAFAELNKDDFFKTEFWDPEAAAQRKSEPEKRRAELPALPELTEPAESFIPMPPPLIDEKAVTGPGAGEPRKVVLEPIRKKRGASELEKIDSATEVPPLKF